MFWRKKPKPIPTPESVQEPSMASVVEVLRQTSPPQPLPATNTNNQAGRNTAPQIFVDNVDVKAWVKSGEDVNGIDFGNVAATFGRYEVAMAFFDIGIPWYEKNVVQKRNPNDDAFQRKQFRQNLKGYIAKRNSFALLIDARTRVLEELTKHPNGIKRNVLASIVIRPESIAFGVFCNQLSKGGWIVQEGEGAKVMVFATRLSMESNAVFVARVIPKPGTSGVWI